MNPQDNLEEVADPPNYDIEEGERSGDWITYGSRLVTISVAAQGLDVTGVEPERQFDL